VEPHNRPSRINLLQRCSLSSDSLLVLIIIILLAMHEILSWIMSLMREHGALSVFIGVIIESIIVPLPSPLIIMGAGALLVTPGQALSSVALEIFLKIVIPGAVASTIGAYFMYVLGYWGGKPLVDRFHTFLGFDWSDVLGFEKRLERGAAWMIFLLRALPIVPLSLVSAAAGALRLPIWMFTLSTLAGSIPRCFLLGWLGYLTRDSYEGLAGNVNRVESIVSAAIVLGAIALILHLRKRMKRIPITPPGS
jgi:membrane protein DedA with SNARE-associated domain